MITVTSKGESYMAQIETPENEEEALLKAIVNMGAPASIEELHRVTNMSTTKCEKLTKRLRKHGMVAITPDSFAGKAAVVLARGVKHISESSRRVDSAKLHRLAFGNPNTVPIHKRHPREEREVLKEGGNEHGESGVRSTRFRRRAR